MRQGKSKRLTVLTRPITRRIGRLVVRISAKGIALRGYRRRQWREYAWPQLAVLATADRFVTATDEIADGLLVLEQMGAWERGQTNDE